MTNIISNSDKPLESDKKEEESRIFIGTGVSECLSPDCTSLYVDYSGKYFVKCNDAKHRIKIKQDNGKK